MVWQILQISLSVAICAVLAALVPAVAAAYVLARFSFSGKSLVEALCYAPLVLPPVVTGYLLLVLFSRKGWLGRWLADFGILVPFTWTAAVLAAAVIAFPLLVRSVRLAVELVDPRLEEAAAGLGASPWRVFFGITLPLASPGVLTGTMLAFARCLGEFGATITFAGNIQGETRSIPLAIYTYLQQPDAEATVWFLVALSLAVSLAALWGSEVCNRRLRVRLGGAHVGA
ncbi:molybdate ABC transporter permease subunit [Acanthopleuribacter pedis]|uniref:Molybdenum transport system permease n=1 Tax=Acanthopleuribacter pedis TaxID=442870 RepID=A0A8J7QE89_9BACT|nr:molybdate ABC transporter permease subunit [Acanthopleuribacter pedis]MBO1322264.1 molybdate ABC transporter permease subunit [Acanthopleuribacter pedis]